MWTRLAVLCGLFAALAGATARAQPCPYPDALGVARVVEIDASSGPLFGGATSHARAEALLRPKEVLLTFDDGPLPNVTQSILDTLDRFCTKATFFSVGKMAQAHPDMLKTVLARGHTVGAHTWSHPQPFSALPLEVAFAEIDSGFTAVAQAAGRPIAPFFRFPGLRHTEPTLEHLRARGVATFGVDVVSDDSFITDPDRLAKLALQRVEARRGGIILFHDIKHQSALALPIVLAELKARGYQVVHVVPKQPIGPVALSTVRPDVARAKQEALRVKQDPPKAKQDSPKAKQELSRAKIIPVKKDAGANETPATPVTIGAAGILVTPANGGAAQAPAVPAGVESPAVPNAGASEAVNPAAAPTGAPDAAAAPEANPNAPTAGRWSSAPIADGASPKASRWSATANRRPTDPPVEKTETP